ncbi:MAG TPA: hypothetical protein P5121_09835 [Caldilineaceae bacterium]|nr:hypothetical protein [Caldilineaceae bacterium]
MAQATLPRLTALLDKSLVQRVGDNRYDLHELVRQYAAAQLAATEQRAAATPSAEQPTTAAQSHACYNETCGISSGAKLVKTPQHLAFVAVAGSP